MRGKGTSKAQARNAGALAYQSGLAAEEQVLALYAETGATLLHRRWRGQAGEIDLILHSGEEVVFVEVKKSRRIDDALQRVTAQQERRIYATASEYLDHLPNGQLSQVRFDVAAVDGMGQIEIHENAIGHF